MSDEERLLVDPNKADLESLAKLPGVGEALARRIHEARPFDGPEDLLRVSGLGKTTLERLSPYLVFEAQPELSYRAEETDMGDAEFEIEPEGVPPKELSKEMDEGVDLGQTVAPSKIAPKADKREPLFNSREPVWLVLGVAVVSVILSILLSLAILGGINRTLDVGKHSAVRQLENELMEMHANLDGISSRLDAIGRRMEAIEGLSGRVRSIEEEFSTLRDEVGQSLDQMETMRASVSDLGEAVNSLSGRIEHFNAFLDGLRELLTNPSTMAEPEATSQP